LSIVLSSSLVIRNLKGERFILKKGEIQYFRLNCSNFQFPMEVYVENIPTSKLHDFEILISSKYSFPGHGKFDQKTSLSNFYIEYDTKVSMLNFSIHAISEVDIILTFTSAKSNFLRLKSTEIEEDIPKEKQIEKNNINWARNYEEMIDKVQAKKKNLIGFASLSKVELFRVEERVGNFSSFFVLNRSRCHE
jgi:hypothetical protein